MSVVVVNDATIRNFVNDEAAFTESIKERFKRLDTDSDGLLSYADMIKELHSFRVLETHYGVDNAKLSTDEEDKVYHTLFDQFDHNHDGNVDLKDFHVEMTKVLLAVADGIGSSPITIILEEGSFLRNAVERESAAAKLGVQSPPAA